MQPLSEDISEELANWNSSGKIDQDVHEAFDVARWARILAVVGHGRSAGLAIYASTLFNTMQIAAVPIVELSAFVPSLWQEEVVAISISHSGKTQETLATTERFIAGGSQTIAITANGKSPLARMADVVVAYNDPGIDIPALSRFSTRLPALYVIESLGRLLYNEQFA